MKAHLAFLCNGRCQWCKSRWDCGKARRFLAKIFGCKDWRWQTLDNYRQYIGWVEQDGEAYAMELLRRCSEQALQEELKINDMRESKDHILPGGSAEAQRADMLRAMEAVSAKMAAERGITRQPLAVLSQSEISRRMSAI